MKSDRKQIDSDRTRSDTLYAMAEQGIPLSLDNYISYVWGAGRTVVDLDGEAVADLPDRFRGEAISRRIEQSDTPLASDKKAKIAMVMEEDAELRSMHPEWFVAPQGNRISSLFNSR